MSTVVEQVPTELRDQVEAAVLWLNRERGHDFAVTGMVDAQEAIARLDREGPGTPLELGLILCDGDLCVREQVRLTEVDGELQVALADAVPSEDPPAELDPQPGVRSAWLDRQLAESAFVVLVFYRGFW